MQALLWTLRCAHTPTLGTICPVRFLQRASDFHLEKGGPFLQQEFSSSSFSALPCRQPELCKAGNRAVCVRKLMWKVPVSGKTPFLKATIVVFVMDNIFFFCVQNVVQQFNTRIAV